jgi:hypothetical protein
MPDVEMFLSEPVKSFLYLTKTITNGNSEGKNIINQTYYT